MENDMLQQLRRARGFVAEEVAAAKLGRMAAFLRGQELDAAVVGVSGGVDSALVLALLQRLHRAGVLRRVVALLLPIDGPGASGQERATAKGRLVAERLGAEAWEAPLTAAQRALIASIAGASRLGFTPWAEGQALSVLRTPALYGAAALLQAHGYRSIVVGTTNRDEGSFLGFYGKASDGMVDLQPISDLHKSEVRMLARHIGVPDEIVNAVPTGDVHDGRSDEEMIGASYDEIELYLRMRELGSDALVDPALRATLESRHRANAHKYRVGGAAVHLDVLPRGVRGGWSDEVLSPRSEWRPPDTALPGAWDPEDIALDPPARLPGASTLDLDGFAIVARDVLTPADCSRLCAAFAACGRSEAVGVTGVRGSYGVGSVRATGWSPELARQLWRRIAPVVPSVRFLGPRDPTDAFATDSRTGHRSWRVVGLSPVLRFMRYERGGHHYGHYDAGYDYRDGRRTLLSLVFYLTDAECGGATRFLRDGQQLLPVHERDFSDWERPARDDEIVAAVQPRAGSALLFDHRLCHDVGTWGGPGPRVIIRADIVYEAIPDGRA